MASSWRSTHKLSIALEKKIKTKKTGKKRVEKWEKSAVQIKVHIKSNSIWMNLVCHSSWTMTMAATAANNMKTKQDEI